MSGKTFLRGFVIGLLLFITIFFYLEMLCSFLMFEIGPVFRQRINTLLDYLKKFPFKLTDKKIG